MDQSLIRPGVQAIETTRIGGDEKGLITLMKNCFHGSQESMLDPELHKFMCDYMLKSFAAKLAKKP